MGTLCRICQERPRETKRTVCSACRSKRDRQSRRRARTELSEHDYRERVPDGYFLRGVSELRDSEGNLVQRWIKSQKDTEDRFQALVDAVASIADEIPALPEVPEPNSPLDTDLLCVYPMGDPHVGMLSWAKETGQDHDLKIVEANIAAAVDHLVSLAPPAEQALIVNLGDFFHSDNAQNRTSKSGHALDVDGRWARVLQVGIRIMRRFIDRALGRHRQVRVICEIGNHDDHSAIMLALCLSESYRNNPRVEIDTSPEKFHWYRFGENLIGVTHGDTCKPAQLPSVMAYDRKQDWGETTYRYWYTGHVHHDSVKDYPGCTVETFRTLAPADAWHRGQGYRSEQDMKLDVIHRKWGRQNRHTVGIRQLWGQS